jgi:hypothetical protein
MFLNIFSSGAVHETLIIFHELPLNSSRTVKLQFKNVHEQLYQNISWKFWIIQELFLNFSQGKRKVSKNASISQVPKL